MTSEALTALPSPFEALGGRVSRNIVWTLASDLVARGTSLGLAFFCARTLPVAGFGLFALTQNVAQYLWLFGDAFANSGYAAREVARAGPGMSGVAGQLYAIRAVAGLLLALLAVAVGIALPVGGGGRSLVLATSIYFLAYSTFPDWVARGVQDFKALALANLLTSGTMVLLVVTMFLGSPGPALACGIWAASLVPGTVVLTVVLSVRHGLRFRPPWAGTAWRFHASRSFIFSLGAIGAMGLTLLPALLLGLLSTAEQVGLFAAGFRIVTALVGLGAVIWWPVYPALASTAQESKEFRSLFEGFLTAMLTVSLPAALGLSIFAEEIVHTVFGSRYVGAVPILRLMAWSVPLYFLATVFEITILATGGESRRVRVYATGVAVLALGSVLLIPAWGAMGAAAAHLGALAVAVTAFFGSMRGLVRAGWLRTTGSRIALGAGGLALLWMVLRQAKVVGVWGLVSLGAIFYVVFVVRSGILPLALFVPAAYRRGADSPGPA